MNDKLLLFVLPLILWIALVECVAPMVRHVYDASAPNIPPSEWDALQELYINTHGDSWTYFDSVRVVPWNFSSTSNNPCTQQWSGLNCTFTEPYEHYYIEAIVLPKFSLVGSLPASIGNFSQLFRLDLRLNDITGTLPASLADLRSLHFLDLQGNHFTGTVPESLGQLSELTFLSLERNRLHGTLPSSLGNLVNLQVIDVGINRLSGSLPASLGNLHNMEHVIFFFNRFTGTIPSKFSGLNSLETFNVFNNTIQGTVPQALCALQNLTMLTLGVNHFSGTIPSCLGTLPKLTYIEIFSNHLSGLLPSSLAQAPALSILILNQNLITGTLDILCEVPTLTQFYVEINRLTGTLPDCLGEVQGLTNMYLFENQISGSIPASYGNLLGLKYVDFSENFISGTLPPGFATLQRLTFLYLFDNLLTGSIPPSYSGLSSLTFLLLQNNFLTGPIANLFNASVQPRLNIIQLSGNAFTGPLPGEALFMHSRTLTIFSAVQNCLSGSIPEVICQCKKLKLLALDGMGAAKACRRTLLHGISQSYVTLNPVTGGVPACLLQMPNLTTLHLSGNGLTGSLPELRLGAHEGVEGVQEVGEEEARQNAGAVRQQAQYGQGLGLGVLGPTLIDLAMSHNMLTGTVPSALQRRIWYNLDLSYNRLSGTLLEDFATVPVHDRIDQSSRFVGQINIDVLYNSSYVHLSLENNRLSGDLPSAVYSLQDLSILNGNLFTCDWPQTDLPEHDSARDNYQCGSAAFDAQLYAWLIILVTTVTLAVLLHRNRKVVSVTLGLPEAAEWCNNWLFALQHPAIQSRMPNFRFVCEVCDVIGKASLWCTALIVLVLVPLYAACTHYYGTITYQYAWTVSAAFLSGPVPFALEMFFYLALLVFLLVLLQRFKDVYLRITDQDEDEREHSRVTMSTRRTGANYATRRQIYGAYATFFACNFTLVMGVNIAFVYIALYQSSTALELAQLFLSFFKGFWNSVGAMYLMRWCFHAVATNDTTRADFINTQLFVALFNNIAIPCLVVAVVSPNCFYNVFVPAPSISFQYIYLECAVFVRDTCLVFYPAIARTSYAPPFAYSYQCGAQFITNYAPTFVYLAIEVAFVTPVGLIALTALHKRVTPGTLLHRLLDHCMYKSMKPLDCPSNFDCHGRLERDVFNPYFDANKLLVLLMTYLGIVLTFGVVFPPLAVVMAVAIFSLILTNRIIMGRYITNAQRLNEQELAAREAAVEQGVTPKGAVQPPLMGDQYLDVVERDSMGVGCLHLDKMRAAVWMMTSYCCMFYALFLFDTLGNAEGASASFWVFIVMPLMPGGIYVLIFLWRRKKRALLWQYLTGRGALAEQPAGEGGEGEGVELGWWTGSAENRNGPVQQHVSVAEGVELGMIAEPRPQGGAELLEGRIGNVNIVNPMYNVSDGDVDNPERLQ